MARFSRSNQRLNGLNVLAYVGDNSTQPPEFVTDNRPPNSTDNRNFALGDIWLDVSTNNPPKAENVWMLVSLQNGVAVWVNFAGAGDLKSLTGNSGGAVFGDASNNIFVIGDTTTINVVGVPGTHTLTISAIGTGVISSLTGNSGGPVFPLAGNINILGDTTTINIVGNPGTHTLTVSAVGTGVISSLTGDSGGPVFPLAGNINTLGTAGKITVTGNPGTHTLTWNLDGSVAQSFPTDFTSAATPAAGVLNIFGGTSLDAEQVSLVYRKNIHTAAVTNTVFVKLNESMSFPATTADGRAGVIYSGGVAAANVFLHNYGTNNTFLGKNTGNLTLTTGSAVNNTALGAGCLTAITTAHNNVAVGIAVANVATTISECTLAGYLCGNLLTTADHISAYGYQAAGQLSTGSNAVAIGTNALFSLTVAGNNVALGVDAGEFLVSGTNSVFLGTNAGKAFTTNESNNICLGFNVQGVLGQSNTTRIGGIRGITTNINDAIAVLIDSSGQLGTVSSSLRYKENIKDMSSYSEVIYKLRPVIFNYKKYQPDDKSVGLIAEEVELIDPSLVVHDDEGFPETVKYHNLTPMLLNEIIKLKDEINALKNRLSLVESK